MPLLAKPARRGLDRLPPAQRSRTLAVIASLDRDPHLGKRLQGPLSDRRPVRLGDWRITYRQRDDGVVVVLRVAPRGAVYKP